MEVGLELTHTRNGRPSCAQRAASPRGWGCPAFWGHGHQRGQQEPTAGDRPNWMTLQDGKAGALSSPHQLATKHICHGEVWGLIASRLTPGNRYSIYCSEGELPGESIPDKHPGDRGATEPWELFPRRISERQRRRQEARAQRRQPIAPGSRGLTCVLVTLTGPQGPGENPRGPKAALPQLAVLFPLPSFLQHLFI